MDLAKLPRAKMQKRVLVGGLARTSNYRGWFHGRNGAPSRGPKGCVGERRRRGREEGGGKREAVVESSARKKRKKKRKQGKEEKCRERSGDDGGGKDSLIFRSLSSAPLADQRYISASVPLVANLSLRFCHSFTRRDERSGQL